MAATAEAKLEQPDFRPEFPTEQIVDFTSPDTYTDGHPYPAYARLRETAPVFWHNDGLSGKGMWLLSRYEDVQYVSRHPELFSSAQGFKAGDQSYKRLGEDIDAAMRRIILALDPPEHTELRQILQPHFTLKAVKGMEDSIRSIVCDILDRLGKDNEIEAVTSVSADLPIIVLCNILGIADADRPKIFDWTNRMVGVDDPDFNTTPQQAAEAFFEVFEYGRRAIEERRREPTDDLLSVLANARVSGKLLEPSQTDGFAALMIGAGNETSRNSITSSLLALDQYPDQRRVVIENPDAWPVAVEELIRFASPVIHMRRTATQDTELAGQKIARGEQVILLYGAANRDPDVFEEPDRLDLQRKNARSHFAFGHGIHLCLGAMFARVDLRLMLQEFLTRFPDYAVASEPRFLRSNFVHGIKSLRLRLKP